MSHVITSQRCPAHLRAKKALGQREGGLPLSTGGARQQAKSRGLTSTLVPYKRLLSTVADASCTVSAKNGVASHISYCGSQDCKAYSTIQELLRMHGGFTVGELPSLLTVTSELDR
jgi:hypothetical protein